MRGLPGDFKYSGILAMLVQIIFGNTGLAMRFRETQVIVLTAVRREGAGKTSLVPFSTAAAFASLVVLGDIAWSTPTRSATRRTTWASIPTKLIRQGKYTLADRLLEPRCRRRKIANPSAGPLRRHASPSFPATGRRSVSVAATRGSEVLKLLADENSRRLGPAGEDLRREHRMRLQKSIDSLRGKFDVVLIDTPPEPRLPR